MTIVLQRKDIAKVTALTAKRHQVSPRAQTDILTNILSAGGVDVAEVPCSSATVRRAGMKVVEEKAQNIKKEFKESLADTGRSLIIYVDGKAGTEFTEEGRKQVKKRVAIIARSSSMEKEQVLGVVVTQSNSGLHMLEAITPVLDD